MRRYQLCPNRTFLLGKSRRTHLDVTDATYLNYNRECSRTEIRSATERWDWQLAIIARAMHMVNEMSKLGTIGKKILRGCVNTNQVQCTNVLQNVLIGTCNTTT